MFFFFFCYIHHIHIYIHNKIQFIRALLMLLILMSTFIHASSSLLLLFLVTVSCFSSTTTAACNDADRSTLSTFSLSISASPPLNWSPSVDCCSWEGIFCDENSGRVTDLRLPSRGLVGPVSASILNLTALSQLRFLDLSINRLSGSLTNDQDLPPNVRTFNLSGNNFHSTIPSSFLEPASNLEAFDVSNNNFFGSIPSSICNFSSNSLQQVDFSNNDFFGPIDQGFGRCSNLKSLRAGFNNFSGEVPFDVYGLLTLEELYLPANKLSGVMDRRIVNLVNLKKLALFGNELTGTIPSDIGRLSNLEQLQLHINRLYGEIPSSLTNCTNLTLLNLRVNSLEGQLSSFDFSNFVQLKTVDLGNNFFSGSLPASLFSCKKLAAVRLATNNFSGEMLPNIAALQSLSFISISRNNLTNFTSALRILSGCKNLTTLILSKNFYDEELPENESLIGPGELENLRILALGGCRFTGVVPLWLKKLTSLEVLDLSYNIMTGFIPGWIGALPNLFYFDLSNNKLNGYFPVEITRQPRLSSQQDSAQGDITYLELPVFVSPNNVSILQYNLVSNLPPAIYLANNSFNGTIPVEIGQLKFIITLSLSGNNFSGTIPQTLSNLANLEFLDLSKNNLTGEIPSSLQNLNFLSFFSVAYNNLRGMIPTGGQFDTFPSTSFEGNPLLCGRVLQRTCSIPPPASTMERGGLLTKKTIIALSFVICAAILAITILVYWAFSNRRIQPKDDPEETASFDSSYPEGLNETSLVVLFPNNKYKTEDLTIIDILKATDNFNQSNIIGCGGFGLVYKATLPNGSTLAIKKLSGDMGLMEREFKAEVEALSTAKHKNLVTLQGYCVHNGLRLLIYTYMENGSLDYWLHEKPDGASQLSWPIRLKISQGASYGVAYMHQICEPHIVHRDLKSSNILLDRELNAHVADFGLARLILPYQTHVTTELVGTLGYIPPEYSQSWTATLRGDVYSFGVVLLELVTGKRPVEVFRPKVSREVVAWVQQMRSEGREEEVFDPLLRGKGFEEEMAEVLDVACLCVDRNPLKRPAIQQVVDRLRAVGLDRETTMMMGQQDD
ncbi:hypothetical protein ABFX02_04G090200 [Erythranthe guttata]